MESLGLVFAGGFSAFNFFFLAVGLLLGINSFGSRHKAALQDIQNRIGVFRFFRFLSSLFRTGSWGHKFLLLFVCAYTFLYFNPQAALSTAKPSNEIYCPNGMAYRVKGGHYIKCEDFDQFHIDEYHGKIRTDLYIKE